MDYSHNIDFKVRDYECDMQGVVNNGVYLNYLEHARHEFLQTRGVNFAELTAQRINLVVIKAELEYKSSLVSNDSFVVRSNVHRVSRLRFEFQQDIYRLADGAIMLSAKITGTALNEKGRPFVPDMLSQLFDFN
jgi:acyl-CoA thioester hydrolase